MEAFGSEEPSGTSHDMDKEDMQDDDPGRENELEASVLAVLYAPCAVRLLLGNINVST